MPLNGADYVSLADDLDWETVRVASLIPGRVRLKSPQLRDDDGLGTRIAEALDSVDAITEVAVNVRTGSVLIRYDEGDLDDLPTLIDQAEAFGVLPEGVDPDDLKAMVQSNADGPASRNFNDEVRGVFDSMDTSVKKATGGAIDLKGLVPLSLVGMGTYRVLSGGATQSLPWFNYFWFAFSIFVAMEAGTSPDEAASSREAASSQEASAFDEAASAANAGSAASDAQPAAATA